MKAILCKTFGPAGDLVLLAQAAEAIDHLSQRRAVGNVVVQVREGRPDACDVSA